MSDEDFGEIVDEMMLKKESELSFEGTPIECEAYVRKVMGSMRNFLVGYTSELVDGEFVPGERQEEVLRTFDNSVWSVVITPEDMVETAPRDDMRDMVERIRLERDLFDALSPKK